MSAVVNSPIEQWAAINRTEKFLMTTPLSGSFLQLPEDVPEIIFLDPAVTAVELGLAVLKTLDRSRYVDGKADRAFYDHKRVLAADKKWHQEVMKYHGDRTKREAYSTMLYCRADRCEGHISIRPYKRDTKPGLWWDLPEDQTVVIPATDDPAIVGTAVQTALSRCS